MDNREHLSLYRRECKHCGHLDPDEPKKYSSCHFSKGNDQCPAAEVQIVVVGRALRMAVQVRHARDARNAEAEARILAAVAKQSSAFQNRFYQALENEISITGDPE